MPRPKQIDLDRILEISIALADAHGFEAVTLASVAAQLDIRIPSLYNHVSGLPGLRDQMRLWALRGLSEALRRAAVGRSGAAAILAAAHAYRAFALAHPGLYPATLRAPAPDEPELTAISQEIVDTLLRLLEPYAFSQEDSLHVIRGLRSLLHGFVALEIAGGFGLALDRDESFRRLLQVFIDGLHPTEKAPAADQ